VFGIYVKYSTPEDYLKKPITTKEKLLEKNGI
jgi:hypothetical protein